MQQKTEKPTPKRLRDARKEGQVPFSRDANAVLTFCIGFIACFSIVGGIERAFVQTYREIADLIARESFAIPVLFGVLKTTLERLALLGLPVVLACAFAGLLLGLVQTKFLLTPMPLKPKLDRLSPMRRLKQWFSAAGLFEFAKTLLKLLVVFGVAYVVLWDDVSDITRIGFLEPKNMLLLGGRFARRFVISIAVVFFGIALLDLVFQTWRNLRDLRMSKEEVKREHKSMEGDPLFKSRRRQIHMELLYQDIARTVAKADAVVVNPTHYAVAIRYDQTRMSAPRVVAKGQDRAARRIIRFARRFGTPVVRDKPLARSLFEVELGDAVPRDLYAAVAEVLTFVYRLRRQQQQQRRGWSPLDSDPATASHQQGMHYRGGEIR